MQYLTGKGEIRRASGQPLQLAAMLPCIGFAQASAGDAKSSDALTLYGGWRGLGGEEGRGKLR